MSDTANNAAVAAEAAAAVAAVASDIAEEAANNPEPEAVTEIIEAQAAADVAVIEAQAEAAVAVTEAEGEAAAAVAEAVGDQNQWRTEISMRLATVETTLLNTAETLGELQGAMQSILDRLEPPPTLQSDADALPVPATPVAPEPEPAPEPPAERRLRHNWI